MPRQLLQERHRDEQGLSRCSVSYPIEFIAFKPIEIHRHGEMVSAETTTRQNSDLTEPSNELSAKKRDGETVEPNNQPANDKE
jgi:hypothetical protein